MILTSRDEWDEGRDMATDLATKVDQLTMRNRMACWLWIQEAGQPIALLSALTGIPRGRLQSLNLNSEDLQTLARHIESLRPLAIDGEVDKRLAEIRARNPTRHPPRTDSERAVPRELPGQMGGRTTNGSPSSRKKSRTSAL